MKLFELIVGDYMCFRFGEVRFFNPNVVPMTILPIDPARMTEDGFQGATIETIVISHDDAEGLPPDQHTPVHCFCALIGNTCYDPKISIAGYCMEREIERLLFTKGETNGKNTSRFPGKNVVIGMMNDGGRIGVLFAITEEKMIDFEGVTVSYIDLHHVLKCDPAVVSRIWAG